MEQLVRVYRPETKWILMLASKLSPRSRVRERTFRLVLEGAIADEIPLAEARRRGV